MSDTLRTSELASAAGISKSYASEILSGKRAPSRALAFQIFSVTGRKFGAISHLSDVDVAVLARMEPSSPAAAPQEEAA